MKVTRTENTLTIDTGVSRAYLESTPDKKVSIYLDEKKTKIFCVALGSTPEIGNFGVVCNGVAGSNAAVVLFLNPEVADKKEYVRKMYGESLAALSKNLGIVAESIATKEAEIEAAMAAIVEA